MFTKEEAQQKIAELTERFAEQITSYKKVDYNETLTRRDFIDPFFKALGWDVDNSQGYAEAYREVIHEDKIKIGAATKAPDYSFRLGGGKRLFFVEAKKPSVYVKDEITPAYQVRRYGWSAKLPISLITDFEEFAIYDCTKKPNLTDKASTARIKYFTYKDYLNEFDFIWNTFSKEKVLKGSFDKFIQSDTHKKGTATVDAAFLAALDEWRKQLAVNIALRNQQLSEDELNYIVQQTIDRIIFLRITEDRSVEPYGQLQMILKAGKEEGAYYKHLFNLFKEADSKYNSGLFDLKKDTLSKNISIDNKVIKAIVNELYYPVSPYEFSVLSVEILGSAYEQFLGKQIKLDAKHRAVIEEKPEVRKAGGVYYTPQYIVDYIVENTVGKLIKNLEEEYKTKASPAGGGMEGAVAKLKIADPACGSGSFLLGAYQYLLTWYQQYYKPKFTELSAIAASTEYTIKQRNDAIKERNKLPLTPDGNLTTALKKQILLNNIYGVDIDTQAVEVTKLSLLLKCMEGETGSSINAELRFGERILPTLDNNIKSGNSLIDLDFYDTEIDFDEENLPAGKAGKIKPFSWQQAFPEVFKQSGKVERHAELVSASPGNTPRPAELVSASPGNAPRHAELVSASPENTPRHAEPVSASPKNNENASTSPEQLHKNQETLKRVQGDDAGFDCIIGNPPYVRIHELNDNIKSYYKSIYRSASNQFDLYQLFYEKGVKLINSDGFLGYITSNKFCVTNYGKPLREILFNETNIVSIIDCSHSNVFGKVSTYPFIFFLNKILKPNNNVELLKDSMGIFQQLKTLSQSSLLKGDQKIFSFDNLDDLQGVIEKIEKAKNAESHIVYRGRGTSKDLIGNTSGIKSITNKEVLRYEPFSKIYYKTENAYENDFDPKILMKKICFNLECSLDLKGTLNPINTVYIIKPLEDISIKYLLGVLNSKLLSFYARKKYSTTGMRGGYIELRVFEVEALPIKIPIPEKIFYNEIINQVDNILQLNQQKQQTTLPEKLEQLNQRIAYTDDKINKLVYELYDLTEEEIKIVEGK